MILGLNKQRETLTNVYVDLHSQDHETLETNGSIRTLTQNLYPFQDIEYKVVVFGQDLVQSIRSKSYSFCHFGFFFRITHFWLNQELNIIRLT